jgi:GT2 family glycosyltransferase
VTVPDLEISVVVCSYNGAARLGACLDALRRQTVIDRAEIIVVDDGSTDGTAELATRGVRLVRHARNKGIAAARTTGGRAARAPIVAYTDDDCVPTENWLEELLKPYDRPEVVAVGGLVCSARTDAFMLRYLAASNPHAPLELDLTVSASLPYRAYLYALRNLRDPDLSSSRPVYALACANFSVRRTALEAVGYFDDTIPFAGEDEDLCRRLGVTFPDAEVLFLPTAVVAHDFDPSLRDTLRRSAAYGRGGARNYLTNPDQGPSVYPLPVVMVLLLVAGLRWRSVALLAIVLPLIAVPRWPLRALRLLHPEALLFSYVQCLQEGANDVGFYQGWRALRGART